jgi:hypothetical protein
MFFPDLEEAICGSIVNILNQPNIMTLTNDRSIHGTRINKWFMGFICLPPIGGKDLLFPYLASPMTDQVPGPTPPTCTVAPGGSSGRPDGGASSLITRIRNSALFFLLLPILRGVNMPNIHPLAEPFPPELVAHNPTLEDWCIAIHWWLHKDIHWLRHLPSTLFDMTVFAKTLPFFANFEFLPSNLHLVVHHMDYNVIKPGGGPAELAEELTEAAWGHLKVMAPAASTPTPGAPGTPTS